MLKITLHDGPEALRFQLEGKLIGPWVRELEQSWRTASSILGQKPLIIDLQDVTFIDNDGRELLARLEQAGAHFRACSPLNQSIVEEVKSRKAARVGILATLFFLAAAPLAAQTQNQNNAPPPTPLRLTLRDAVQLALKQNPQVQIANLNVAESEERRKVARSGLLPQAGAGVSETVRRANIETAFGSRIPGFRQHIGPFWISDAGVNVSAPVFDLTLWRRYQAAGEDARAARAQNLTVREQSVLLVVSQYLGGLRATADVKAAQSRVDLAKALFDLAEDLLKNGVGTGIDSLRANVQYQNEQQRLIQARTQLETSLYGLSRLLNLDPRQPVELADEVSFFETPAINVDQSLERAYANRPEMQQLLALERAANYDRKAAGAARLPRLTVSGGWTQEGLTPTRIIPVYQYQAGITVPLFTGGRIQADMATADLELRKIAQNKQELQNQIALQVKTALAQLASARSEVDVANQGVKLANEEVTQARDRFHAGVANNIEVITAQDELARANDNQIVALYRYNQSRADLAHAIGQMESLYAK